MLLVTNIITIFIKSVIMVSVFAKKKWIARYRNPKRVTQKPTFRTSKPYQIIF